MAGSTRRRFAGATSVSALALLAAVAVGQPASATYPAAANGPIIFGVKTPDGQANLFSVAPDGTDMQQLTNAKGFNACPAASTDGSQVAYCSDQTGNLEIWMMDADGSNSHQVTHTGGRVFFPDISPDGTKLTFQGTIGTDPTSQIWVSAIDGSGIVQLTAETAATGDANYPAWSPDGSKIAYIGVQGGLEQVFLMNADGSNKTQLTTDAVNHDQVPDWSPDGSKIAYADGDGADEHVFVMNADGSDPTALTTGTGDDWGPTWSPDGTQIAFRSGRGGPDSAIFLMNSDGSNVHVVLAPDTGKPQLQPAWLPLAAAAQPSASN